MGCCNLAGLLLCLAQISFYFSIVQVATAIALGVYQVHQSHGKKEDEVVIWTQYYVQISLQLASVIILKFKVKWASGRMTLFKTFGLKVLLMHTIFLGIRTVFHPIDDQYEQLGDWRTNSLALIIATGTLCTMKGNWSSLNAFGGENRDVTILLIIAVGWAFNQWFFHDCCGPQKFDQRVVLDNVIRVATNLEVLCFMPAVWMIISMGSSMSFFSPMESVSDVSDAKRFTMFFNIFLGLYYLYEDVITMPEWMLEDHCAMAWMFFHFIMILDLVGFFSYHVYDAGASKREDNQELCNPTDEKKPTSE